MGSGSTNQLFGYVTLPSECKSKRIWLADCIYPVSLKIASQISESDPLTFHRAQRALTINVLRGEVGRAFWGIRWAENERPSIRGGNRLNTRSHEGTEHTYRQNRDPDCQLCIQLFHCRAPFWDLRFSCSAHPSQVTLVVHPSFQNPHIRLPRARARILRRKIRG